MSQTVDGELVFPLVDAKQHFVFLDKLAGSAVWRLVGNSPGHFRRQRNLTKRHDGTVQFDRQLTAVFFHRDGFDKRQRLVWMYPGRLLLQTHQEYETTHAGSQDEQRDDNPKGDIQSA